jgi:TonB family protein
MNPVHRLVWLGFVLSVGLDSAAQAPTPPSAAPSLVSHVLPTYPQIAQSARVQGLVEIGATIESDGRVAPAVRVNRSIPLLDQAAIDAIRQWRFAPSDTSAKVTVTVRFVLNDPFRYPRPATYSRPLPPWIPGNLAFVYLYQCRRTSVEIDSIAQSVTNTRGYPPTARRFAFGFDVEQASEVFITLVGAGLFDASLEVTRKPYDGSTWQEAAPVEPGLQQAGDRIIVTVSAETPVVDVQGARQIQWFGGDQPTLYATHTLRVRRGDRWTQFTWNEPLGPRSAEHVKEFALAGKRIRALVKRNLTDARIRPDCL